MCFRYQPEVVNSRRISLLLALSLCIRQSKRRSRGRCVPSHAMVYLAMARDHSGTRINKTSTQLFWVELIVGGRMDGRLSADTFL
ncbi:hypothetical protein OH492_16575 [Vibrio chagasii]|nr:hypothetical protein [Vibrio chagasii]